MMQREALDQNTALTIISMDKFKSSYLAFSLAVPLTRETAAKNTLLMKILKRGTQSYPDMIALSKKLEYLYSADIFTRCYSLGETQFLNISMDVLNDAYTMEKTDLIEEALEVLGEIMYAPVLENGIFRQTYFESEKRNLLAEIDAEINNKGKYAFSRMRELMCDKERYGASPLGIKAYVETFTNEDLYAHYQDVLASAPIEILFVGNTDEKKLKNALLRLLHGRAPKRVFPMETEVIRRAPSVRTIVEESIGNQGNLVLGFRTGTVLADGNYPVLALFCELYGGSPASKLFVNVREKLSLCYYCVSHAEAIKGLMFVRAGIENENFEAAKNEILLQLSLLQSGAFTDEELNAAKLSLCNAYLEMADSPQSLETWYMGRAISGLSQSPEAAAEAVQKITKSEIVEIANKITLDTVYFLKSTGALRGEQ